MDDVIRIALRAIKVQTKRTFVWEDWCLHIYSKILSTLQSTSQQDQGRRSLYHKAKYTSPLQWSERILDHIHRTQADFVSFLDWSVVIISRARNRLQALMELVGLTSSFLFLSFESCNSRLDLRQLIIYDINLLVDLVECLGKRVALGFQFALGLLEGSSSTIQRIDFSTSWFHLISEIVSLLRDLFLSSMISKAFLSSENFHPMALDERCWD